MSDNLSVRFVRRSDFDQWLPLWTGYPEARRPRSIAWTVIGFVGASAVLFFMLLFAPSPLHEAHVFLDRTVKFQIGRASPFSIWDWGQYHAKGLPSLRILQRADESTDALHGAIAHDPQIRHRYVAHGGILVLERFEQQRDDDLRIDRRALAKLAERAKRFAADDGIVGVERVAQRVDRGRPHEAQREPRLPSAAGSTI